MIGKTVICPSCAGEYKVRQYCTITKCPYCGTEKEFKGFSYKKIDYSSVNWQWVEESTDCPKCMSPNMIYSDEKDCFHCLDCGYELTKDWLSKTVIWFCDKCGAYLNIQSGFSTYTGSWKCRVCGYDNDVTEDNIL